MRFAICNGKKTNARDVVSGTIGKDLWYKTYDVVACVGKYRQYWRYVGEKPELPPGYENESEWHARWKSLVDDEHVEVIFGDNNEHRADIFTGKEIIEIQRSPIDIRDAQERTTFYKTLFPESKVIWIINVVDAWKKRNITVIKAKTEDKYDNFIWKYPRKWILDLTGKNTMVLLDFNEQKDLLLRIWIHGNEWCCRWMKKSQFYKDYLEIVAAKDYEKRPEKAIEDLLKNTER